MSTVKSATLKTPSLVHKSKLRAMFLTHYHFLEEFSKLHLRLFLSAECSVLTMDSKGKDAEKAGSISYFHKFDIMTVKKQIKTSAQNEILK